MNKKALLILVLLALFQLTTVSAKITIVESEESGAAAAAESGSEAAAAEESGDEESGEESGDEESAAQTQPLKAAEESSEDSCHQKQTKVCITDSESSNKGESGAAESGMNDEDRKKMVKAALDPIDSWMKDFKKRTGGGGDLKGMAAMTVKPLIKRLRRAQEEAVEKLKEKNAEVLTHVEAQTMDHAMKLLRAEQKVQQKADEVEAKKEKAEEAQAEVEQKAESAALAKEEEQKAESGAKESSGAAEASGASASASALSKALRRRR